MSEKIEEIYDRLVAEEKLKSGTKYERLAAIVWQVLDRSSLVVHDVWLRADGKRSKHQIDVTATNRQGAKRRILIECRDRAAKVSKDEAAAFHSEIVQLKPDAAWILSPVGFKKGAKELAADEGIGLALLRPATPADDEGRVKRIIVRGEYDAMGTPTITTWLPSNQEEADRLEPLLADRLGDRMLINTHETCVYDDSGEVVGSLESVLTPIFNRLELEPGENEGTYLFDEPLSIDLAGVRGMFRGFSYTVPFARAIDEFTIGEANAVAELVISSLDGTIDRVVYDGEIAQLTFDDEGTVVLRSP